jgi:hypothetical protein
VRSLRGRSGEKPHHSYGIKCRIIILSGLAAVSAAAGPETVRQSLVATDPSDLSHGIAVFAAWPRRLGGLGLTAL